MKTKLMTCVSIFVICMLCISCGPNSKSHAENKSEFPELKGHYLGQTPPGDIPELFAPGIVADIYREHKSPVFTPDGKEVFWTRCLNQGAESRSDIILHMKLKNGIWTKPELAPFFKSFFGHINSISPDGKRLYYRCGDPVGEKRDRASVRNMVVDKTDTGWGEPRINKPIPNWKGNLGLFQETKSGSLYFQADMETGGARYKFGCYRAKMVNQKIQPPKPLGETINTKHLDYAFCVDPDERFIIFASTRPGGFTETDLYISYHREDDSWGPAINLGKKINSPDAYFNSWPSLSPDGKYLFFIRGANPYGNMTRDNFTYARMKEISLSYENGHGKIYWVNTSFIKKLRPKKLR